MMDRDNTNIFSLLPEAMVEEMLSKSQNIGKVLLNNFQEVNKKKQVFREQLESSNLLKNVSELPHVPAPTTVGVDGAHAIERLLATDIVACAAVAIEGLTPPAEAAKWEKPYHRVFINPQPHHTDTSFIIRGIMWELEIILASSTPHDIVFLDGSITNPFINLNAALGRIAKFPPSELIDELEQNFPIFLDAYHSIITSQRTDKLWVGIPKYTSKRELGDRFDWPVNYDDRSILTSVLKPGEFIAPIEYDQPLEPWHIGMKKLKSYKEHGENFEKKLSEIVDAICNLHVCYYRPHPYTPVLRIEVPQHIKSNNYLMSTLLNAVSYQCGTPGIIEPYPLYMADKMVKNISTAVPAFRQTATLEMAQSFDDDLSEIFFAMHAYRTEL